MTPAERSDSPRAGNPAGKLNTEPVFDAENILLQRRMRFNPLRALDPENLSMALDQFEIGILRMAALLWDAMCKRDDTLITVKPQLENSIASKDWGVFKKKGADEKEAARHAAALEYFYEHVRATDAFDRNERGGKERLIAQMMRSDAFQYAVHHFVWKPKPGVMIEVEGSKPVPALTAELEYVPLWYFENTTGTLRFLPFGGFGVIGQEMDWENEWMVTTGRGLMFAAAISYVFKRLTFQDWTIFNERYAQNKVVGMTNATKESDQGQALLKVIEEFNGDQGIAFFECGSTDKPPIQLLGPEGAAAVEIFERFIERQDRKIASMFRGNDLSMMSRGGVGEKPTGASLQGDEGDAMERGCCRTIAGALHEGIDRKVIRFCFGEDVEPLAYFGLPDMDVENTADLRESAGFLADRGAPVALAHIANRLGVELATEEEDTLQPAAQPVVTPVAPTRTENAAGMDLEVARLLELVDAALTANGNSNFKPDEPRNERGRWTSTVGAKITIHPGTHSADPGDYIRKSGIADYTQWHSIKNPDQMPLRDAYVKTLHEAGHVTFHESQTPASNKTSLTQDEDVIKESDYQKSPDPIKPHEAVAKLTSGYEIEGGNGKRYKFGNKLLEKFSTKGDGDKRLAHLPHAEETLKHPFNEENQSSQDMFIGLFKHNEKHIHVYVFTTPQGEVSDVKNYYLPKKKQVEKELRRTKEKN